MCVCMCVCVCVRERQREREKEREREREYSAYCVLLANNNLIYDDVQYKHSTQLI